MDLLSPSAIKMNRNGESGSPFLMPLDVLKVEIGVPLSRIEKKEEDISHIIQWIQVGWKPNALRVSLMYFQLILSNAFDMSNLMSISGVLFSFRE